MRRRLLLSLAIGAALITSTPATDPVLACGIGESTPIFANIVYPADTDAYLRGELGIVHPTYARLYLIGAYRRFEGLAAMPAFQPAIVEPLREPDTLRQWLAAREAVLQTGRARQPYELQTYRAVKPYQYFRNCLGGAFTAAAATLRARAERFGAASAQVTEWIRGQDAVFDNCGDRKDVAVPAALPAGTDPLLVADRAYQIAASYFYSGDYDRAGELFRAIDADRTSPWRRFGRYLAARALIRRATILEDADPAPLLARAERELDAIVNDPTLAEAHEAARSLRAYVATKLRPVERLHEASAQLASAAVATSRDVDDYTYLMDRLVGDTTTYSYTAVPNRAEMIRGDALTDWILALQGRGPEGLARALDQWKRTRSPAWLIAALWNTPPQHAEMPDLLDAAAVLPRESPAFATAAFLRVRAMAARGDRDGARRVLGGLPAAPAPGFPADAVNLLEAQRLMLATTLDELLRNIPRLAVGYGWSFGALDTYSAPKAAAPALDRDGMLVLGERLPLTRLLDAAKSPILPRPMRLSIASAVLTRAILLRRDEAGLAAVDIWRSLEPSVAARFTPYVNAPDPNARHNEGILMILRYPRMQAYAQSEAGAGTYTARNLIHGGANWWCSAALDKESGASGMYRDYQLTSVPEIVSFKKIPDFPEFLTERERSDAVGELQAIAALGTAPNYLADEAVKWAQAQPKNPAAAEALALAVEGTRWGCSTSDTGTYSRRAFQTLHRLFPASTWAKRTKYWYTGR